MDICLLHKEAQVPPEHIRARLPGPCAEPATPMLQGGCYEPAEGETGGGGRSFRRQAVVLAEPLGLSGFWPFPLHPAGVRRGADLPLVHSGHFCPMKAQLYCQTPTSQQETPGSIHPPISLILSSCLCLCLFWTPLAPLQFGELSGVPRKPAERSRASQNFGIGGSCLAPSPTWG